MTDLDPLGAPKSSVDLGGVVPRDPPRENVQEDHHGQHVPSLEGAHEPDHAEEQDKEAHRPELNTAPHADLFDNANGGGFAGISGLEGEGGGRRASLAGGCSGAHVLRTRLL